MKKIYLVILFSLFVSISYAQDANKELLKKLVDKEILTQEEANEIAKESTETANKNGIKEGIQKAYSALKNPYFEVGGYALLHHSYSNTKNIKHDSSVRAAFLSIKGEPMNKLSYVVFANLRNPSLTEYYVDWRPYEALQFRVGQYKVPISIENQLSLTVLEFIQNTRTVDYLVGGANDVLTTQNGKNSSGRDIGIKIYGRLLKIKNRNWLEYDLGVFQGSGINKSAYRNNKDLSVNLLISPFQGFRIGGGVHFGEAVYSTNLLEPEVKHGRNRWLISADYKSERFTARAEWIRGNDSSIKKEGVYGLATWAFVPNKWIALAKVDYYNNNTDFGQEALDYSAGINYHITKTCRLQANYTYSDYSKKWGDRSSHLVEAQFQIVY